MHPTRQLKVDEAVRLTDTHCHLNLEEHFPDPDAEIQRSLDAGVTTLILVGIDVATSARALEIADRHATVYAVVGLHPNYSASYSAADLQAIEELAKHPKAMAIGEIGLDFHWDYATPEQQERSLRDQLALAEDAGLPVVFHCRKAYPQLLSILEALPVQPYLFHCFSGDGEDLQRASRLGGLLGIDGPITYRKSTELREQVTLMPSDRIVIETDSPYLSPEPLRGKPNVPANLRFVNNALATILSVSAEESAALTSANAARFFRLPNQA
jgi:TatD DNase family protein